MEGFFKLLKNARAFLTSRPAEPQNIHFTLGNESCDLDSCIGALSLAVLLAKQHPDRVVVPVLNVTRENFLLRTENCFVLNQAQVPMCSLIYRDEVDFEFLLLKHSVSVSLVDHHILSKGDHVLAPHVVQVFDHRPVDASCNWDPQRVKICIEPVGSCCTLIASCMLKTLDCVALNRVLAYLLYQTIIYDTIALKPENHKATPQDIEVAEKLENLYGFNEDRQVLFDRLWAAHNDVSHLTPGQLLLKDLKLVEGVYIPGLPMLVEEFLSLEGSLGAVAAFAQQRQVSAILLVGLNASGGTVQRDLAVYSIAPLDPLGTTLLKALVSQKSEFLLEEKAIKFGANIRLLHIHNLRLSRKQLVPIVKQAWQAHMKDTD